MSSQKLDNVLIEGGKLLWKNFAGKAGQYTSEGDRNFNVIIEQDLANVLAEDGWNVRYLEPLNEGEPLQPFIPVKVSYKIKPPRIVMINSVGAKKVLPENEIFLLDFADIVHADLTLSPYPWTLNGKSGVKAYLKSLYVTIAEDPLETKYRDVPDSAAAAIGGCGNCEECDGTCEH